MKISTLHRSKETEKMDDFSLEGIMLKTALDKIATINQLLGGNAITLQGVAKLLAKGSTEKEVTILDIGCGNGDMLRKLADYGIKNNLKLRFIGLDANPYTISHAQNLSQKYANIEFYCVNLFSDAFDDFQYDMALMTLTLHHFTDDEIIGLLTKISNKASLGIVVNDLQRSLLAYRLFQALCFVFRLNELSREDGLISILRGFKKQELIAFSQKINASQYHIQWKWAFRYQWIISKT